MDQEAFVFLDSSFSVSQNIQLSVIRDYASEKKLSIIFYGSELTGFEFKHYILNDFLKRRPCNNIIFFSLSQFCTNNSLSLKALGSVLSAEVCVHFAAQKISEPNIADIKNLHLLSLSRQDFAWLSTDSLKH